MWAPLNASANRIKNTYLRGFLDMSGGDLFLQNGNVNIMTGNLSVNKNSLANYPLDVNGIVNISGNLFIGRDASFNGNLVLGGTTVSTGINNGAFILAGGAGIGGNTFIGGNLNIGRDASFNGNLVLGGTTVSTGINNGAFILAGGAGIGGNTFIGGNLNIGRDASFNGNLVLGGTTVSTDINNGAFIVAGGAGIGGNTFIGGNLNIGRDASFNGNLILGGITATTGLNTGALIVSGGVSIAGNVWIGGNNTNITNITGTLNPLTLIDKSLLFSTTQSIDFSFNSLLNNNLFIPTSILANWTGVATSANGQYVTAVINNSNTYISSNYGFTWTSVIAASAKTSVAMSANGQYQLVGASAYYYTSSNYGISWTTSTPSSIGITSVAMSSTGQYQLITFGTNTTNTNTATNSTNIYASSNYGSSFSFITPTINNIDCQCIALSATGQYQVVGYGGSSQGNIYLSSNYGSSWIQPSGISNLYFKTVSISANGQYQTAAIGCRQGGSAVAGTTTGNIYSSTNYGSTWSAVGPTTLSWQSISMSANGQYQVACSSSSGTGTTGTIWFSNNYGNLYSWTQLNTNNNVWNSVSISSNCQYIYACAGSSNYVYTYTTPYPNMAITGYTNSTSTLTGSLVVYGSGGMGIGGNAFIGGNLNIARDASFNGNLNIARDASFNGNLTVGKLTYLIGNLSIGKTTNSYALDLNGNFNQSGATTFSTGTGAITLAGAVTASAGITIPSGQTLTNTGGISGAGSISTSGNFTQSGATTFSTGTGAITLAGAVTASAGISTNNANINAGTGTITSGSVTCGKINASISASSSVNNFTYFNSNNSFSTQIEVGKDETVSGCNVFGYSYNSGAPYGFLGLYGASGTQICMDNNGVLIGSIAKPSNSTTYKLEVGGATYLNGVVTTNNNNINAGTGTVSCGPITNSGIITSTNYVIFKNTAKTNTNSVFFTNSGTNNQWGIQQYDYLASNMGSLYLSRIGSNDIVISGTNGYVGINTANPAQTLHINGHSYTQGTIIGYSTVSSSSAAPDSGAGSSSTPNPHGLILTNNKGTSTIYSMALGMDINSGYGYINAGGAGNTQPILLQSRGGVVGINYASTSYAGGTNPNSSYSLDVNGNILCNGLKVINNASYGSVVLVSGDTTHNGYIAIYKPDGYRAGYIGWNSTPNYIDMEVENGYLGYRVIGNLIVDNNLTASLINATTLQESGTNISSTYAPIKQIMANFTISGGGNVSFTTVGSANYLYWTNRIIVIPLINSYSTSGYFETGTTPPTSGTIPYYGRNTSTVSTITCNANGIPLIDWDALYMKITPGGSSTGFSFFVTNFNNSALILDNTCILIAVVNGHYSPYTLKYLPGSCVIQLGNTYNAGYGTLANPTFTGTINCAALTTTGTIQCTSLTSSTSASTNNFPLFVAASSLGSTIGNCVNFSYFNVTTTNNCKLFTYAYRWNTGSDWQSSSFRIQAVTDTTMQGYIEFNNPNNGVALRGSSGNGLVVNSNGNISVSNNTTGNSSANTLATFYDTNQSPSSQQMIKVGSTNSAYCNNVLGMSYTSTSNPYGFLGLSGAGPTQICYDSNGVYIGQYGTPPNSGSYKLEVQGSTLIGGTIVINNTVTPSFGTGASAGSLIFKHNTNTQSSIIFEGNSSGNSNGGGGDGASIVFYDNINSAGLYNYYGISSQTETCALVLNVQNDANGVAGPDSLVLKAGGYVVMDPGNSVHVMVGSRNAENTAAAGGMTIGNNGSGAVISQNTSCDLTVQGGIGTNDWVRIATAGRGIYWPNGGAGFYANNENIIRTNNNASINTGTGSLNCNGFYSSLNSAIVTPSVATGPILRIGDGADDTGSSYGALNIIRGPNELTRAYLAFTRNGYYVWQFGYIYNTNNFGIFPWNYTSQVTSSSVPTIGFYNSGVSIMKNTLTSNCALDINGNVRIANNNVLNFGNSTNNCKICLYGDTTDNTVTNYYGFGINDSTLRYCSQGTHKFYKDTTLLATIDATGNFSCPGNINPTGSFYTWNISPLVSFNGNYQVVFRNDGTSFYILINGSSSSFGSWNGLRPFYFNLSTGYVNIENGATINGGLYSNAVRIGTSTQNASCDLTVNGGIGTNDFFRVNTAGNGIYWQTGGAGFYANNELIIRTINNANINTGTGNVTANNFYGTLQTAAQPNITSVGTLTALYSSGTINANTLQEGGTNISSTYAKLNNPTFTGGPYTNDFFRVNTAGNGIYWQTGGAGFYANNELIIRTYNNSSINTGTGNVTANNFYGTIQTAAQPNITSVGTLTSLTSSGTITSTAVTCNGILNVTSSTYINDWLRIKNNSTGIYWENLGIGLYASSANTVSTYNNANFSTTGSGRITSTSFNATSDYRIKENIKPITNSIDVLNPIQYYNKQLKKEDMGFIAHEVQEHFPFLVTGEKDEKEMQSLNYSGFIALLTKEIQDLKKDKINKTEEIENLKKENQYLKSKLDNIEFLLTELISKK